MSAGTHACILCNFRASCVYSFTLARAPGRCKYSLHVAHVAYSYTCTALQLSLGVQCYSLLSVAGSHRPRTAHIGLARLTSAVRGDGSRRRALVLLSIADALDHEVNESTTDRCRCRCRCRYRSGTGTGAGTGDGEDTQERTMT